MSKNLLKKKMRRQDMKNKWKKYDTWRCRWRDEIAKTLEAFEGRNYKNKGL